ncbi:MAG: nodulation protein NodZ [Burkholderiales bacterium]|nr:nodulation protein NodZ [Burkholderiales bacterium]
MKLRVNYGESHVNEVNFIPATSVSIDGNGGISFSVDSPCYIQSSTRSLSIPPVISDLDLEKDCYYLLSLDIKEIRGSVILFLLFYDDTKKIDTVEFVLNNANNRLLFHVPQHYMSCKISFRIIGSGAMLLDNCSIEIKPNILEVIAVLFNSAFENGDKRLTSYYYKQMKLLDVHGFDIYTYKNFLLSAFSIDDEDYIKFLINLIQYDNSFQSLNTDVFLQKNINTFRMKYLDSYTTTICSELSSKGIKNYVVNIINSGFGDILSIGSMVSYFSERLGLTFTGVLSLNDAKYKNHYLDLISRIGLKDCSCDDKIYFVKIHDIQEDLAKFILDIATLESGKFDTLCLIPTTPNSFSGLRNNTDFNKNIFNNGFHKYFIQLVRDSKLFTLTQNNIQKDISITIHLRLGDVAAIKIKKFVIIPFDVQNDRYDTGISLLATIDKSNHLYSQHMLLDNLQQFIEDMRKTHNNLKLNLITDGYSTTRLKLKQNNIMEKCFARGLDYNVNDVDVIIDEYEKKLQSILFDIASIGDNASQDFINSVNILINSDIIISSSRSFVFNVLSNFKFNSFKKQIFYSPLRGGYFESLKSNNVELENLVPFNILRDNINNKLKTLNNYIPLDYNDIINISPYAYYYTSSIGDWEKQKSGSPLDGQRDKSRYSFHTMKEDNPFIIVYFKEPIIVEILEIIFRDKYSDQIFPLIISVSGDGTDWCNLDTIVAPTERYVNKYLSTYGAIKYLRVQRTGYGYLFLSSINIFINKITFLEQMELNKNSMKTIFVYSPFYGLGGRLETLASAFGYLQKSNFKNILVDWGANKVSKLLQYPFQSVYEGNNKDLIMRSLNPAVAAQLLSLETKYKTERNISHWRAPTSLEANDSEAIFISRDSLGEFVGKRENLYSCMQRLYKNIIPSAHVLQRVSDIEKNHNIVSYSNAIGIQVRHGNGEKYYNPNSKQWGVKPPSKNEIIASIRNFLDKTLIKVDTLILASDCSAVKEIICVEFKNQLDIIFISDFIQPIGSGCNHLSSTFSKKAVRTNIDQEIDEINNFAEIICLSKCAGLIGGKSYFFNSIIGYSNCEPQNIMRINNNDRYIQLDDALIPLEYIENDQSQKVLNVLSKYNILSDGIFIKVVSLSVIQINYFDIILFDGLLEHLELNIDAIAKCLQQNRLY